jgi:hypothetical protein
MFLEGQIIEYLDKPAEGQFVRKQEHDRLQVVDPQTVRRINGDRVVVVHQKTSEDGFRELRDLSEKIHNRQIEMDVELLWESLGVISAIHACRACQLVLLGVVADAVSAVFSFALGRHTVLSTEGNSIPRTPDRW